MNGQPTENSPSTSPDTTGPVNTTGPIQIDIGLTDDNETIFMAWPSSPASNAITFSPVQAIEVAIILIAYARRIRPPIAGGGQPVDPELISTSASPGSEPGEEPAFPSAA